MKRWALSVKCLEHDLGQVHWKMLKKKKVGLVFWEMLGKKNSSQMKMIHVEKMQVVVPKKMNYCD